MTSAWPLPRAKDVQKNIIRFLCEELEPCTFNSDACMLVLKPKHDIALNLTKEEIDECVVDVTRPQFERMWYAVQNLRCAFDAYCELQAQKAGASDLFDELQEVHKRAKELKSAVKVYVSKWDWALPAADLPRELPSLLCEQLAPSTYDSADNRFRFGDHYEFRFTVAQEQLEIFAVNVENTQFKRLWSALQNLKHALANSRYVNNTFSHSNTDFSNIDAKIHLFAKELDLSLIDYIAECVENASETCTKCGREFVFVLDTSKELDFHASYHCSKSTECKACFVPPKCNPKECRYAAMHAKRVRNAREMEDIKSSVKRNKIL